MTFRSLQSASVHSQALMDLLRQRQLGQRQGSPHDLPGDGSGRHLIASCRNVAPRLALKRFHWEKILTPCLQYSFNASHDSGCP